MSDPTTNERLARAKRIFIGNLVILGIAIAIAALILTVDDADSSGTGQPEAIDKKVALSDYTPEEIAYLKGQVLALSQHPNTMPEFDEEWVRPYCKKITKDDPLLADTNNEDHEALLAEFIRGYTERFHHYYDDTVARQAGYHFGLRYYPADSHVLEEQKSIRYKLEAERTRLSAKFHITDEAMWEYFCHVFEKGFWKGYPVIEPGVTAKDIYQTVELIEE